MKSAAIPAGVAAIAVASMAGQVSAHAKDSFAEACKAIETGLRKDRNVCVIGIAEEDSKVRVVYATNPAMRGKVVTVYRSPIVQGALVPLAELSANERKLVAVGGVDNADSIFSATFLEAAGPWFAAAIEALAK
jgi:pyruvate carboxylase